MMSIGYCMVLARDCSSKGWRRIDVGTSAVLQAVRYL